MELGISLQLYQAATAWLFGFAIGICYDMLKTVRLRFRKPLLHTLFDVLFSILLLAGLFFQGMYLGRGSLRIFMLLANALGIVLYFLVLSRFVLLVFGKILEKTLKIVQFVIKPFVEICAISRKVYIMQKRALQKHLKRYIIKDKLQHKRAKGQEGKHSERQKNKHDNQAGRRGICCLPFYHTNRTAKSNRVNRNTKRRTRSASDATRRGK